MKKMYLLTLGVVLFCSMIACQKEGLNEIEQIEFIDKDEVHPDDRT